MITWMQRHRKYLVVTIWISTIAFIGAGFVGWGQYSYGDKAGAVAKVGDVPITAAELQKSYSSLFSQYNQLFQGRFDQKQAQQMGLERQALQMLINQALILNLANSYGLTVTDQEIFDVIKTQGDFMKGGSFDKSLYAEALKQNGMTIREYEDMLRKELLIQKVLLLLDSPSTAFESKNLAAVNGVQDNVSYKLLTPAMITIQTDEAGVKAFWEKNQKEFMTEPTYEISVVRQNVSAATPSEEAIKEYYEANRATLKDAEGKLLSATDARSAIIAALNDKAAEKEALHLYIDYKKGELKSSITPEKITFTPSASPFSPELTKEITSLSTQKPILKPRKDANGYIIVKLEKANASRMKTFEEAKNEASALYAGEQKKAKLQELAQKSYQSFVGTQSGFVGRNDASKLTGLSTSEAEEFLSRLFAAKQKQGFVTLSSGNVIIYNVLEQKLLQDSVTADANAVARLKGNLREKGLLKTLETKYPVQIYVEGM